MLIVDELRETIFKTDSDFLAKLANTWSSTNADFLAWHGRENAEPVFLNILTEEIHRNMPNYKVFTHIDLKGIPELPSEAKVEKILGTRLEDVRKKVCELRGRADDICVSKKCFVGQYPMGTEIDALIIRDKDLCVIEYEKERRSLCNDFMKMYRLQQLLDKQFESLFVTKLTTMPQPDSPTTFKSFNDYIDSIKTILDTLLQNWSILEIVDLSGSETRRHIHWRCRRKLVSKI